MIEETYTILKDIYKYPEKDISVLIKPLEIISPDEHLSHHFLTFLKPEILSIQHDVNVKQVLSFVLEFYQRWGVYLGGIRVLSGTYLLQHKLISKNYEMLHKISYNGMDACSERIKHNLFKTFEEYIKSNTKILGGHQFLNYHFELTARKLNETISDLRTYKLGSGVYAVYLKYKGDSYILLNAFHPFQVELLTLQGSALIALECFSSHSWSKLREDFIGAIVPQNAKEGSFRREIYKNQRAFNIKDVNITYNGIHISPGPIEAIFQLINFFVKEEDSEGILPQFRLVKELLNDGRSLKSMIQLKNNPLSKNINEPFESPIFEWTENMSHNDAVSFLKRNMI